MNHVLRSHYTALDGTVFRSSLCGLVTPPDLGGGDIIPLVEVARRSSRLGEAACPQCVNAALQHEMDECDPNGTQLDADEMFPSDYYPAWMLLLVWFIMVVAVALGVAFFMGMLAGCSTPEAGASSALFPDCRDRQ